MLRLFVHSSFSCHVKAFAPKQHAGQHQTRRMKASWKQSNLWQVLDWSGGLSTKCYYIKHGASIFFDSLSSKYKQYYNLVIGSAIMNAWKRLG